MQGLPPALKDCCMLSEATHFPLFGQLTEAHDNDVLTYSELPLLQLCLGLHVRLCACWWLWGRWRVGE
eukprot:25568-Chlamydomonas_euryale.AAC.1